MVKNISIRKKITQVNLLRGLLLGLFAVLCLRSFLALRRVEEVDRNMVEEHIHVGRQPGGRKKVLAFVGVQVRNKGGR